jgi:hypothetical protein
MTNMKLTTVLNVALSIYAIALVYTYVSMPVTPHTSVMFWGPASQRILDKVFGTVRTELISSAASAAHIWIGKRPDELNVVETIYTFIYIPIRNNAYSWFGYLMAKRASSKAVGFLRLNSELSVFEKIRQFIASHSATLFVSDSLGTQIAINNQQWSFGKWAIDTGRYILSYVVAAVCKLTG